ncbi:MAG: glycine zipper 2TM domain-containing protein [Gallionella sp.]|nr:glycine zipper 2TM domain-containing protein [Gallionella sp.]MDD4947554.1 glycine zipper 2TM domain-containing protein [Gallionella sp.]MDD5611709.1 glycine zipper 2TM domain-containing protein [Gallionella sp.]
MKKNLLALGIASLFGNVYASDFVDTARVVSSTPIYDRVNQPRRECWNETMQGAPQDRSMTGAVVGGVAGGLLGSQVGGGSGNTAATGAGAVAGAMVGDRVANPDSNRSSTGAIVGGVAGALLGSQVGGGNGNRAATAAGGIAGVLIGDRIANPSQSAPQQVQRCRDVDNYQDVIRGYNVTYRYNGRDFTTTLPYDPGSTVRVGISLIQEPQPPARQPAPQYRYDGQDRQYQRDRRDQQDRQYRDGGRY